MEIVGVMMILPFGSQLAGEKGFSAVRVPHYLQFEAMSRDIVMGDLSVKPVVVDRLELASIYQPPPPLRIDHPSRYPYS